MTDSAVNKLFGDLDYPGRRKPKNRVKAAPVVVDTPLWDAKPLYYHVGGVKQEFFVISHLARALGYSVQSIRAWEDRGLLPRSPYRSPRTRGKIGGSGTNKGKRLWTRAQIEAILALARKHRVILNKEPPTRDFARDVAQEFQRLLDEKT